jgi:hypothetical protein
VYERYGSATGITSLRSDKRCAADCRVDVHAAGAGDLGERLSGRRADHRERDSGESGHLLSAGEEAFDSQWSSSTTIGHPPVVGPTPPGDAIIAQQACASN